MVSWTEDGRTDTTNRIILPAIVVGKHATTERDSNSILRCESVFFIYCSKGLKENDKLVGYLPVGLLVPVNCFLTRFIIIMKHTKYIG